MIILNVLDSSAAPVQLKTLDAYLVEPYFATLAAQPLLASNLFGTVTHGNAKASAGAIRSIYVTNEDATARYFQIFAKASTPVAGTDIPITGGSFKIPAGTANAPGMLKLDFGVAGLAIAMGVSWAISTTRGTFTDSATASEHDLALQYV